jgi:4'-phosphopantetheinyl transferase
VGGSLDTLPPVAIQVWWCAPVEPYPAVLALLDDDEHARHLRLRRPEDRARHATAHGLLRLVLGRLLDRPPAQLRLDRTCPECGQPHGKPRLVGGGPEFSLTHSGGLVGVAVAEVPVGIDVEDLSRPGLGRAVEEETLTPAERAMLDGLDADARHAGFLRLWTRKEALLKASGTGLSVPPHQVPVDPPGPARVWDLDPGAGFVGALAAVSDAELTVRQMQAEALLGAVSPPCR